MSLSAKLRRRLVDLFGDRDAANELATAVNTGAGGISDVTAGKVPIGDGAGYTARTLSGDVTNNSTGVVTIAAQAVTLAKFARGTNGQIIVGQTGAAAAYATVTGDITIDQTAVTTLNANLANRTVLIAVEDLAADADITSRIVAAFPTAVTLVSAALIAQGSFAGVDNSNTMAVTLKQGSNTIVTKTYNGTTVPTDNGVNDLGALDGTFKSVAANVPVTLTITNGSTANPPSMLLRLTYRPTNA